MKSGSTPSLTSPSPERLAYFFLISSTFVALVSVFGFKFFTLNSAMLVEYPWAMKLYPYSFKVFAQAQILLGFLSAILLLWARLGRAWIASFVGVYLISLASEFMGTSWGIPFGHYEYTDLLGYKLFDRVPWLIPCSWFFMGLSSYRLSQAILGRTRSPSRWPVMGVRCLLATLILVLWDITLDPAMSYTTPFWVWAEKGSYYGMPTLNIFGWLLTGFIIMLSFETLLGPKKTETLSVTHCIGLYLANLCLPLGLLASVGAWTPLGLTLFFGALIWIVGRWVGSRFAQHGRAPIPLRGFPI